VVIMFCYIENVTSNIDEMSKLSKSHKKR